MPRTKTKSLGRQQATDDIQEMLEDAQREINGGRWKEAHRLLQCATLLTKALLSTPVRARTLKAIPNHDIRYSQSLERGLTIMACFSPARPVMGIADVADLLGMSRSTTHRYMMSLVALGQLERTAGSKYRLVELQG